jgi:carotenoid cleavage dioxygenase-like enzyme
MDLPLVFDLQMAMDTPLPYRYDPSFGARLGVLSRRDPHGVVRWFDIDPCYVFHALNAHDAGGVITLDVCRLADPSTERIGDIDSLLWRWTIDLEAGTVTERQLDDRPGDFPRVDDRLTGLDAPRGWVTSTPGPSDLQGAGAIVVYDLATGVSHTHQLGPGRVAGEAVFAPSDANPGGPGWLLAYVYDAARDRSELVVIDPDRPEEQPVATVHLPARVPYGFHGSWLPD